MFFTTVSIIIAVSVIRWVYCNRPRQVSEPNTDIMNFENNPHQDNLSVFSIGSDEEEEFVNELDIDFTSVSEKNSSHGVYATIIQNAIKAKLEN